MLVFLEQTLAWPIAKASAITLESLASVVAAGREGTTALLVVGCGPRFLPPPRDLGRELWTHGVALEWMDTGAAVRTFNVLLIEERQVAAALIAVE